MDSIYTDFSKAFDRVRHCLLLDKMSSDIEPAARCQWLRSHFFGLVQRIRMEYCVSRDIIGTPSVPQDSRLGQLFFIWFMNEMFEYV
jgi:hypothetical protein